MMISVDLTKEEATALLTFLRLVGADVVRDDIDVPTFNKASEKLRVALRHVVEPGWVRE